MLTPLPFTTLLMLWRGRRTLKKALHICDACNLHHIPFMYRNLADIDALAKWGSGISEQLRRCRNVVR